MAGYDYIVTGAGSAGCVVAARLSEDPAARVLLLEAGGDDRNRLFHIPAGFAKMTKGIASWGWSTVPQRQMNDRVLWYTQAKVLGGGSSINAQIYTRGNAAVYDSWASDHGCDGWGFGDLLPYFRRAEANQRFSDAYHGTEGPMGVSDPLAPLPVAYAFLRAAQDYGIPYNPDFNGATVEGCGFYQLTQKNARRSSTARAHLAEARARPNLTVRTGAEALRILCRSGRATGVEFAVDGRRETADADAEVIVTSGAIGSPRLLMLSGIGPAAHLGEIGIDIVQDLPGVGSNLQDHLDLFVIAACSGPHSYDRYARPHLALWAGAQYYLTGRGPAASSLFETGAFWHSSGSTTGDLQFHLGQGSGIEAGVARMAQGGITLNAAHVQPKSRGSVRLASDDPAAAPRIDPNYWAEPDDRRRAIEGLRIARDILRQQALAPFLDDERLPGPDIPDTDAALFAYACAHAKTQHHPVGACRMGTGDDAVLTPDLRVRGIDGLRVCDSSVMPAITASNTNAATIAIGEKAADLIRGNRRSA